MEGAAAIEDHDWQCSRLEAERAIPEDLAAGIQATGPRSAE
jgi:hypothetical protein